MNIHEHMDIPTPEHQSIFTDTYHGVPSPTIPHTHPYPTRFHGPIYTTPRFGLPYREGSWQAPIQSPLLVPHPTTSCATCQPGAASGFGATPALMGSATGNNILDAVIGAAIGYVVANKQSERALWAGGGAAAALLAGTLGLLGVVGAGIYMRKGG